VIRDEKSNFKKLIITYNVKLSTNNVTYNAPRMYNQNEIEEVLIKVISISRHDQKSE